MAVYIDKVGLCYLTIACLSIHCLIHPFLYTFSECGTFDRMTKHNVLEDKVRTMKHIRHEEKIERRRKGRMRRRDTWHDKTI